MKGLTTYIILAAGLCAACTKIEKIEYAPVGIVPVYELVYDYSRDRSPQLIDSVERDSAVIASFMKTVSKEPYDSSLLVWWSNSMPVEVFTPDVDSIFPSLQPLELSLGHILGRATVDSLELPHRDYAAVVYGRPESMLFVDSVLLIALNHYLGADYPGYSHWPSYMRMRKSPEQLPYDMAEALVATSYPYEAEGEQATLLSRMLYEGALIKAKMQLVADADAALALGYSPEEMKWIKENEGKIWEDMVARQMLYSTSAVLIEHFTAPSPQVREVLPPSPGRIGRYFGYQIVESYCRRHPEAELRRLLTSEFYTSASSFIESQYSVK